MRSNIAIKYGDGNKIYFYSHWDGADMKEILKNALIRGKERWNDEAYLARIIFSEMIKDNILDLTGYGIAPYEMDKNYETIVVDIKNKTITPKETSFAEFIA